MTTAIAAPEFPLPVVIDTREQRGYDFADLRCAARGRPLTIRTVRLALGAGDYSLAGWQHQVAIERKSRADLFSTIGQAPARFQRELARLNVLRLAAVVVEAEWSDILAGPPPHAKLHPKVIYRRVIDWQQRFPRIHWWLCPGRRFAEITTWRVLENFYHQAARL